MFNYYRDLQTKKCKDEKILKSACFILQIIEVKNQHFQFISHFRRKEAFVFLWQINIYVCMSSLSYIYSALFIGTWEILLKQRHLYRVTHHLV